MNSRAFMSAVALSCLLVALPGWSLEKDQVSCPAEVEPTLDFAQRLRMHLMGTASDDFCGDPYIAICSVWGKSEREQEARIRGLRLRARDVALRKVALSLGRSPDRFKFHDLLSVPPFLMLSAIQIYAQL